MNLIHALQCGIRGAERGLALFFTVDGDARVMAFRDKAGLHRAGYSVALDDFGSATLYADTLCRVTVKNEAGNTVRSFVAGVGAKSVETLSTITSASERAVPSEVLELHPDSGYRMLSNLLDDVDNSFGSIDWNVLDLGVKRRLQDSFASRIGSFYDVSSAAYDGNLTAAIDAAQAGGGGIVYIPGGTTVSINGEQGLPDTVSLLGDGAGTSVVLVLGNSGIRVQRSITGRGNFIEGISIESDVSCSGPLLTFSDGAKNVCRDMSVDGTLGYATLVRVEDSADYSTHVSMSDCVFRCGPSGVYAFDSMVTNPETRTSVSGGVVKFSDDAGVYSQIIGTNIHFRLTQFVISVAFSAERHWAMYHRNGAANLKASFIECKTPNIANTPNNYVVFDLGDIVEGDVFFERANVGSGTWLSLLQFSGDVYSASIRSYSTGFRYLDMSPTTVVMNEHINMGDLSKRRVPSMRADGTIATGGMLLTASESETPLPGSEAAMFVCFKDDADIYIGVNADQYIKMPFVKLSTAAPQMCGMRVVKTVLNGKQAWFATCVSGDSFVIAPVLYQVASYGA